MHCTPFMRQRHSGGLSAEGGRNSILRSRPPFMGNSPDLPQASVHGLADQPLSFRADLRSPPHAVDRSICDLSQCTTPGLSISFPDMSVKGIVVLFHTWDFPGVLYTYSPTPLLTAVLGGFERLRVRFCCWPPCSPGSHGTATLWSCQ